MATIITRETGGTAKNSPLTNAELDSNFINLNNEITNLSAPASASSAGLMSASDKTKLDGVAAGAQVNTVNSVAGKTGAVTLVKADVGLGSVNDTSDAAKPVSTAMQTALNGKFDKTGGNVNGNINFTGTARRITGDFSNATVANRGMVQTNVLNGTTLLRAIPNGSGATAGYQAGNSSDPANQSTVTLLADPNRVAVVSGSNGAGSVLPLVLDVSGERLRIDPTTGNVGIGTSAPKNKFVISEAGAQGLEILPNTAGVTWISSFNRATASASPLALEGSSLIFNAPSAQFAGVFGYGVGAGGAVVQATSKNTAVTLNKVAGKITTHGAEMAVGSLVMFDCLNTVAAGVCVCVATIDTATPNYWDYGIAAVATGGGRITFRLTNLATVPRAAQVIINFVVLKGAAT